MTVDNPVAFAHRLPPGLTGGRANEQPGLTFLSFESHPFPVQTPTRPQENPLSIWYEKPEYIAVNGRRLENRSPSSDSLGVIPIPSSSKQLSEAPHNGKKRKPRPAAGLIFFAPQQVGFHGSFPSKPRLCNSRLTGHVATPS
jgi:hypothetical protein